MAGIDLHSNNLFCGIVDAEGKHVFEKKLPCALPPVLQTLAPFKERLDTVAVESTYNWYWLVDGLQDGGYHTVLANPAAMEQYSGLKHSDDKSDAFWLAEMLRLKILPTGYICERSLRSVRDLLRRRLMLVRKRTALILSLQSLHARTLGQALNLGEVKLIGVEAVRKNFTHPAEKLISGLDVELIEHLTKSIKQIEKMVLAMTKPLPCYEVLQSLPGVGRILGLTITLETADVKRFATAGDYASYCRCVDSQRMSNGKKKGENNGKCGNKYLSWAYVEAANFAKRYDGRCRQFHDRKAARANKIIATKALACKLAKAAWHMMSNQRAYDPIRMFPPAPSPTSDNTGRRIYALRVDPAARSGQEGESWSPRSAVVEPKPAPPARRVEFGDQNTTPAGNGLGQDQAIGCRRDCRARTTPNGREHPETTITRKPGGKRCAAARQSGVGVKRPKPPKKTIDGTVSGNPGKGLAQSPED
jgi:transposase